MGNLTVYLPLAGMVLAAASIFILLRFITPRPKEIDSLYTETFNEHMKNKWTKIGQRGPIARFFQLLLLMIGVYFRNWKTPAIRSRIGRQLVAAGYPGALSFETYCALLVVTFCVGLGLGIFFSINMMPPDSHNPTLLIIMSGLGGYLPLLWLSEKVQTRRWTIAKELPYKIDLLILSVEAGMDLQSAIENVVQRDNTDSPLREELFIMLQAIRMGKTRKEAMRDMAERLEIDALNSLVGNIIQGEAMGTPIGHILRSQSDAIRLQRTYRAEKLAGQAPVKLIFPLLFIFMAVFLVLFGSIIIRYMRGEFNL